MIPIDLLTLTESRAPGLVAYGGPGLKKTNAIHTLPPPILMYDFEGGTGSLLPWIRRKRMFDDVRWVEYSDAHRQAAFDILNDKVRATVRIRPAPLIDIISYDVTMHESYNQFVGDLGSVQTTEYNSLALDSLQEFSIDIQTFSRGSGNYDKLMNEVPMSWMQAQERAQRSLRKLRDYRNSGIFIYMTGSEDIAKEYVKDPIGTKRERGQPAPEPYSIRGTVNLPGKLAESLAHLPDILCHARLLSGNPTWVTKPEPITGGDAFWDAKDRFGRLEEYVSPDVRKICVSLYGQEVAEKIYGLYKDQT